MSQLVRVLSAAGLVLALAAPITVPAHAAKIVLNPCDVGSIQNPAVPNDIRLLLRFEMPPELAAGRVELAVLELDAAVSVPDTLGALTIDGFLVTAEWDGETVDWIQGWDAPGGDIDRTFHAVWTTHQGNARTIRFDVTDPVSVWSARERENWGVMLAVAPEEGGMFAPAGLDGRGSRGARVTVWYTPLREE